MNHPDPNVAMPADDSSLFPQFTAASHFQVSKTSKSTVEKSYNLHLHWVS